MTEEEIAAELDEGKTLAEILDHEEKSAAAEALKKAEEAKRQPADQRYADNQGNVLIEGWLPGNLAVEFEQLGLEKAEEPAEPVKGGKTLKAAKSPAKAAAAEEPAEKTWKDLGYYDIKLVDFDTNEPFYVPEDNATITLKGLTLTGGDLRVLHILDSAEAITKADAVTMPVTDFAALTEDDLRTSVAAAAQFDGAETEDVDHVYVEMLDAEPGDEEGSVIFETGSFSIYLIQEEEGGDIVTPRRKYNFEVPVRDENGEPTGEYEPYEFINTGGYYVTYQYIKTGDSLEDVGTPYVNGDEKFSGWYLFDKTTGRQGEQIVFGQPITVTETAEETQYYVRPGFGTVYYINYYETTYESQILTRKQYLAAEEGVNTGFAQCDLESQTMNAPDAELAFQGWSFKPFTPADVPDNPNKKDYSADVRVSLLDMNEEEFAEALTAAGLSSEHVKLEEGMLIFDQDLKLYPIFKAAHWVRFISAPTGTGATYINPAFVLATRTTADAKPNDDIEMKWTGYVFQYWTKTPTINVSNNTYIEFTNAPDRYEFNEFLNSDLTLYAYWVPSNQTNYTIAYYAQVSTDSVNQNPKNYEYIGSRTEQGTTKSAVQATEEDRNGTALITNADGATSQVLDIPEGYYLNESKSVLVGNVNADGSTILSVYFDRNVYTLAFTARGNYYQDYVIATDNNGTQYGYDELTGEYPLLTKKSETTYGYRFRYIYNTSNDNFSLINDKYGLIDSNYVELSREGGLFDRHWEYGNGVRYTGDDFFTRDNNNRGAYNYAGKFYKRSGNSIPYTFTETTDLTGTLYGYDGHGYIELQRNNGTTTTYWELNGQRYYGTRYKLQNTNQHTVKTIVALYGHNIGAEFPITGNNGTSYGGVAWSVPNGAHYLVPGYQFLSLDTMIPESLTFSYDGQGSGTHIYYYIQIVDGENLEGETTRVHNGITYKLHKDILTSSNVRLTEAEEFHDIEGFEQGDFYPDYIFTNYGLPSECYLYYTRKTHNLEFRDSVTNAILNSNPPHSVQFEAELKDLEPNPNNIPTSSLPGYSFKGWYSDRELEHEFDWDNTTMPNHDVVVYAGWEQVWFRVEVDPNMGQLTEGESTFFWLHYGDTIQPYNDITREFVEDPDGTYYYHYHPYSNFQEDDYNQPDYYSYWGRIANYDELTTTPHYKWDPTAQNDDGTTGAYVPDGYVEDIHTTNFGEIKYSPEKGAYGLVGWYRVQLDSEGNIVYDTNGEPKLAGVYDFGTQITSNTVIRAVWRKTGSYRVRYATTGYLQDAEGNRTADPSIIGSDNPSDTFTYADKSESAIMKGVKAPSGYGFIGWYYDGHVYQPGDVFQVKSELSELIEDNHVITIEPVFMKADDMPVQTSSIILNGNGGVLKAAVSDAQGFSGAAGAATASTELLPLNTKVTLLGEDAFERPGYTFKGWAFTSNATAINFAADALVGIDNLDRSSATAGNDATNTLYAVWDQDHVNIYYQAIGTSGTVDIAQELNIPAADGPVTGSTASVSEPVAAYEFVGWFKDVEGTQAVDNSWVSGNKLTPGKVQKTVADKTFEVYEHATYYAKFAEKNVKIVYQVVGPDGCETACTVDPTQETVPMASGNPSSTAATSSQTYKFVGWYDNAECTGTALTTEATFSPAKVNGVHVAKTYYAKFEYNQYIVKFDKNSDEATGTMTDQTFTYGEAQALTANAFSRTGYTFKGWALADDKTKVEYTNSQTVTDIASPETNNEVTLYAVWEINEYELTIHYVKLTGGTAYEDHTETLKYKASYSVNSEPLTGYTVDKETVSGTMPAENVVVTVTYTPIEYTATFDVKGGNAITNATKTFTIEDTLPFEVPTRTGYIFNGWKITSDVTGTSWTENKQYAAGATQADANMYGDVTFTAQWTPITYTVKFDKNETAGTTAVTGTMADQTFTYDVEQALTKNTYERVGYDFTGWNTKADGTGTGYDDEAAVKNLANTQGAEVTVYAQWKVHTYKVEFNGNGNTNTDVTMADQSFKYDEEKALSKNLFEKVYTVTYDGNGATNTDVLTAAGGSKPFTFGGWTGKDANTYTDEQPVKNLTAVDNDVFTMTAIWTAPVITLPTPVRAGWTFQHWTCDADSKTYAAGAEYTMPDQNVTFTAVWSQDLGRITITKSNAKYANETFLYKVESVSLVDTAHDKIELTVMIAVDANGYGQVVLADVPYGTYKVTCLNDWSWRYEDEASQTKSVPDPAKPSDPVDFPHTNGRDKLKWLDGFAYRRKDGPVNND
ncbi:MAG: InlB B-repeat-containing protein [Firmicutes bacterium]|nr:InlB B-repeat-containing protein [Bacillota bacterium]